MKADHDRIWLTSGDWDKDWGPSEYGDVSWCTEMIEDNDVEYVNVRLYDAQAARIAELEAAIAEAIGDLDWLRIDKARDRLFEMVKLDGAEEA